MNLDRKYIEINKKNATEVITFLYNKHYFWDLYNVPDFDFTLTSTKNHFDDNYNKILYIVFHGNGFEFTSYKPNICEYVNIKHLIRENKLKRILKTKSKGLLK